MPARALVVQPCLPTVSHGDSVPILHGIFAALGAPTMEGRGQRAGSIDENCQMLPCLPATRFGEAPIMAEKDKGGQKNEDKPPPPPDPETIVNSVNRGGGTRKPIRATDDD